METRQFRKNSHISQKKFLRSHEVVFQAIRKRNNLQNCNGNVFFFFAFKGHMVYVKSHIIILQCTITSKNYFIRARSEYKGLSLSLMLRQFTLHTSAVIRDTATEADH